MFEVNDFIFLLIAGLVLAFSWVAYCSFRYPGAIKCDEHSGVGGWLMFLSFGLFALIPMLSIFMLWGYTAQYAPRVALKVGLEQWNGYAIAIWLTYLVMVIGSVLSGMYLTLRRTPHSVIFTISYLWLIFIPCSTLIPVWLNQSFGLDTYLISLTPLSAMAGGFIEGFVPYSWSASYFHAIGGSLELFYGGLVFVGSTIGWTMYLLISKRVRNTYAFEFRDYARLVFRVWKRQMTTVLTNHTQGSSENTMFNGTDKHYSPETSGRSHFPDEEIAYIQAMKELQSDSKREGLWVKAWANSDGNQTVAEAKYIKERATEILNSAVIPSTN